MLEELCTAWRQYEAAAHPLEQYEPEFFLERINLAPQGGLRQPHCPCGSR
jgi:hypothetical protein